MLTPESAAVAVARAHAEAWSNRDFATARENVTAGVRVTATSTDTEIPDSDLTGVDAYMTGLTTFAQGVVELERVVFHAVPE